MPSAIAHPAARRSSGAGDGGLDLRLSYRHQVPAGKGGAHSIENFVLACMPCNQEKHANDIDEYRGLAADAGLVDLVLAPRGGFVRERRTGVSAGVHWLW
jgi:hypothetical protein